MTARQNIFAVIVALSLFVLIIELVRRRKLKEEYSWLWLVIGVFMLVPVVKYDILDWITGLIGAVVHTTTLFLFAILSLILVGIFLSVKLSVLSIQVKNLAQELTITRSELDELKHNNDNS